MSIELKLLVWAVILTLIQCLIAVTGAFLQVGLPKLAGNREDLPAITRKVIEHFFSRYKELEEDKWVKVSGWASRSAAEDAIRKAIAAAKD